MATASSATRPRPQVTEISPRPGEADLSVDLQRFARGPVMPDVRQLSQVSNWQSAATIAVQWGLILAAGMAAVCVGTWWSYLLAMIVIGSRQLALGVLVHDGTHYLLFTHRKVNDMVCDLFCAFPVGLSTSLYRKTHLAHHRFTNTSDDPDWVVMQRDDDFHFPKTPREALGLLVRSSLGLNLYKMKNLMVNWSPSTNLFKPINEDFPLRARVAFVLSTALVYLAAIASGYWWQALLLYGVPALTVFHFFNQVRLTAEHIGAPGTHELNATRTVIPTRLERFLIAPLGVNFHLEHHLFPSVPWRNLSRLHRRLMEEPEFRAQAHITRSYLGPRKGLVGELLMPGDAAAESVRLAHDAAPGTAK